MPSTPIPADASSSVAQADGDGLVTVTVRDTGIGIPAEHQPRLFEMFSQVDQGIERSTRRAWHRSGARQGLGRDARRQRSRFIARGSGLGCEFVVRLPLAQSEYDGPEQSPTGDCNAGSPSRRILVVDDNRDAATSLVMMLVLLGHDTRMAHDGLEAVELAEAFRPDLVLLDIGLPKLNGYDACRRIRQQPWGQGMVIVAATGWGQEEDRRRSHEAGFRSPHGQASRHRPRWSSCSAP